MVLLGAVLSMLVTPATSVRSAELEEIAISFEVPKVVTKDMLVRYDGTSMYLPVSDVFRLLDINCHFDPQTKKLSGFFLNRDNLYQIDPSTFKATLKDREFPMLPSDCFVIDNDIYMKLDMFRTVFGLMMQFDFSLLRVLLPLNENFPSYQKLKRQEARNKLQKAEAKLRNVKEIPPKREYFSGGVADWMISANPLGGGGQYLDLNLGSMLLGGDFSLSGSGNTVNGFSADQLAYKWHYAFDSNKYVTQTEFGSIYPSVPLGRALKGVMVTNQPQTQRTYFQTIHLNGKLEPGWEAELFVDNRLTDFATSDQTGEYDFAVDLMYGSSTIALKLYGPNGEIKTEEQQVRIPYNLIPKKTIEYTVGGGEVTTPLGKRLHAMPGAYYGVTSNFTVGAGMDLPLASDKKEKVLYAGQATYQVFGNLTASSLISPSNTLQASLNYMLPTFATAGASFARYYDNPYKQTVNQLSNATFSISAPLKIHSRYLGLRYYMSFDKYTTFKAMTINTGFNTSLWKVNLNYTGKYKVTTYPDRKSRTLASQILATVNLSRWFRPQFRFDYDHELKSLSRFGVYVNKRIFGTGQITLSYERNSAAKSNAIMLTFNIFNKVAYFSSRLLYADRQVSMSQIQRGSIRYDRVGEALRFDRRNGVGYGSAVIRPFLDTNNDGVMSKDETALPALRAKVAGMGGRTVNRNSLYYYEGLKPYDEYMVEIDATSLDDPTLKPAYDNFKISLNPNVVTSIDVPVVVASDLSGKVERQTPEGSTGIGGIKVKVLNLSRDVASDITTFNNGEYYYLGLIPGHYRAYIDPEQLSKYGYTTTPESIEFDVLPSDKSGSIQNINFTLIPKP